MIPSICTYPKYSFKINIANIEAPTDSSSVLIDMVVGFIIFKR